MNTRFKLEGGKMVYNTNGKFRFINVKPDGRSTEQFTRDHDFYYCDLGSVGFVYPTQQ